MIMANTGEIEGTIIEIKDVENHIRETCTDQKILRMYSNLSNIEESDDNDEQNSNLSFKINYIAHCYIHFLNIIENQNEINNLHNCDILHSLETKYEKICTEAHLCAICLRKYQKRSRVVSLPSCKHIFHTKCLCEQLKKSMNSKCALCREPINF